MAAALPYIAVALSGYSAVQQSNAASDARRAARENARRIQAENAEEARRLEREQKAREAEARARAGASGVGGVSQEGVLKDMVTEHRKELQWLKKSGNVRSQSARTQGNLAYKQGIASAFGTAAAGATSFYNSGAGQGD